MLVAVLAAVALAACGSTINRPIEVATKVGGGTGGTATTAAASSGTAATGAASPSAAAGSGGFTGASGAGGGSTATASGSGAAASSGPVKTGPIELGFMISKTSNAAAFGGSLPEQVDQHDIYNALVHHQNKLGGLHGRPITPVFATTDSASSNFDADLAAACSTFTEDHHVEAVVGRISDLYDSLESCLNKLQIPHLAGTPEAKDATFLRQYPYLFDTISLTQEQRTRLKVDYGIQAGILKPSDKIGVVFAGCPATLRSWNGDAAPYFKAKGLNVASVFYTRCPNSANDAVTEVGKIGNLILQFRSAGVNVLYFQDSELACLFIIANAAEAQGWRPTYFVSTLANTAVSGTQIPAAQKPNVYGIGWSAASDVLRPQWPALTPPQSQCLATLRSEGVTPVTPLDNINAFIMCDDFSLLVQAVDATGGRVDGPSVAGAIHRMGTSHQSAYTYDGTSSYSGGLQTGVATAYPFKWNAACSCYAYSGGRVTVP